MNILSKQISLISTLALLLINVSYSQVSYKEVDSGYINNLFNQEIIGKVQKKELNPLQVKRKVDSIKQFVEESKKPLPFIFGVEIKVDYNTNNSGTWIESNGKWYWILKINSKNALSLNIVFDSLQLPKFGKMYMYNKEKNFLVGPIKNIDNPDGNSYGTDIIKGNSLTIVYDSPIGVTKPNINLKYIVHGFTELGDFEKGVTRSISSLAPCYKDVLCLSGWQDVSNSIARIVAGGSVCSATLVNNTSQDGKPYILTAKHCVDNYPNPIDPGAFSFRFKYRKTTCGGSTIETYYTMTGASIKKLYTPADAALLELNITIPESKDPYFSGWSRENNPSGYFYNISHPAGAPQQIARAHHPSNLPTFSGNSNMWYPEFTYGGNEGGSSGSALFDANHRIVGGSQTATANAPCGPGLRSQYSKFHIIWDEFKQWLDPMNLNLTYLDGRYGACAETVVSNRTITSNETISGCNIRIFNVDIQNNADVVIDAENSAVIEYDFEVSLGSTLEIMY